MDDELGYAILKFEGLTPDELRGSRIPETYLLNILCALYFPGKTELFIYFIPGGTLDDDRPCATILNDPYDESLCRRINDALTISTPIPMTVEHSEAIFSRQPTQAEIATIIESVIATVKPEQVITITANYLKVPASIVDQSGLPLDKLWG